MEEECLEKRLIITSKSEIPEEINFGVRIKRHDLVSYFDEADFLIPQQVDSVVAERKKVIKVISADTGCVCTSLPFVSEAYLVNVTHIYGQF